MILSGLISVFLIGHDIKDGHLDPCRHFTGKLVQRVAEHEALEEERELKHLFQWTTNEINKSPADSAKTKALIRLRKEGNDLLQQLNRGDEKFRNKFRKIKSFSLFYSFIESYFGNSSGDRARTDIQDFFFTNIMNPDFQELASAIEESPKYFDMSDRLKRLIASYFYLANILSNPDFGYLLSKATLILSNAYTNHEAGDKTRIDLKALERSLLSRSFEISHPLQEAAEKAGIKINNLLVFYENKRSIEILSRLTEMPWWARKSEKEKSMAFFYLNYAAYVEERSQIPLQKEVLNNSVNFVLDQKKDFRVVALKDAGGLAHDDGSIEISLTYLEIDEVTGKINGHAEFYALNVFAHEVSHQISKVRRNRSSNYFEEEYRAWQVGYIAQYGRFPKIFDVLGRIHFLISNNLYSELVDLWRFDPGSIYPYLQALKISEPQKLRPHTLDSYRFVNYAQSLMPANHWNETAPSWGWEGFHVNGTKK